VHRRTFSLFTSVFFLNSNRFPSLSRLIWQRCVARSGDQHSLAIFSIRAPRSSVSRTRFSSNHICTMYLQCDAIDFDISYTGIGRCICYLTAQCDGSVQYGKCLVDKRYAIFDLFLAKHVHALSDRSYVTHRIPTSHPSHFSLLQVRSLLSAKMSSIKPYWYQPFRSRNISPSFPFSQSHFTLRKLLWTCLAHPSHPSRPSPKKLLNTFKIAESLG